MTPALALIPALASGAAGIAGAGSTLGALAAGGSALAAGISAMSSISAGNTQAAIANQNAETAKVNAGSAMNTAEAETARLERGTQRKLATAETAMAGNGVDIASGSPLDVMGDMAAEGALDAQIARWRGGQTAAGYLTQADQQRQQGQAARTAGYVGAGTGLLANAVSGLQQRVLLAGLNGRQ